MVAPVRVFNSVTVALPIAPPLSSVMVPTSPANSCACNSAGAKTKIANSKAHKCVRADRIIDAAPVFRFLPSAGTPMPHPWKTRSHSNRGITGTCALATLYPQDSLIESSFEVLSTGDGPPPATPKNHARKDRDSVIPSHQLKENCG